MPMSNRWRKRFAIAFTNRTREQLRLPRVRLLTRAVGYFSMTAKIVGLFISNGGVPKLPIARGFVSETGIEGDRQRNLKYHGGVERALCLYSQEVIAQLQSEGHPIAPGTTGENVLIEGLDWSLVKPAVQLKLGEIVVEVTRPTTPCKTIVASFKDGDFMRVHHRKAPHDSRVYVRVLETGEVCVGDAVSIVNQPRA